MNPEEDRRPPKYEQIYAVVRKIPPGKVATYGQIARIVGGCTARMVGYAMSALRKDDVPWQRVINSKGEVSQHGDGYGTSLQRELLAVEGVEFNSKGRVNFDKAGWNGPEEDLEDLLK